MSILNWFLVLFLTAASATGGWPVVSRRIDFDVEPETSNSHLVGANVVNDLLDLSSGRLACGAASAGEHVNVNAGESTCFGVLVVLEAVAVNFTTLVHC